MSFLKRFTNFILPSISTTFLILVLILFLNSSAQFKTKDLLNLFLILLPFYTLLSFIFIFLITEFLSFLFETSFVKSFFNAKLVASLFASVSVAMGVLFFFNSRYFSIYIIPQILKKLNFWSILLILLGFISSYLLLRLKIPSFIYILFYLIIFSLLFLSSKERYSLESPSISAGFEWVKGRKIIVLEMEGLTLDFIAPLSSEKRLPNFSHAMENGSWSMIKNFRPQDRKTLFASFETGKYPYKHKGFEHCYQFKYFSSCLSLLPRFIFLYKLEMFGILEKKPMSSSSKGIISVLESSKHPFFLVEPSNPQPTSESLLRFKNIIGEFPKNPMTDILLNSFIQDESVFREAMSIKEKSNPIYLHVFLSGLDTIEHRFWKFSRPEQPLWGEEENIPLYSMVIERYYDYYDSIIGSFLSAMKEDEILLIYSPHGMSPIPLWKRVLNFLYGSEEISAYHDNAPDGIAIFIGSGINKNGFQGEAKIVDIAPTLLYLMGFPVARDMDGNVIKRAIDPAVLKRNPIFFVRSFEGEISIMKKK